MADTATQFRIQAIVTGLQSVEALKNSVRQLQSTATPAAADIDKLRNAATALGGATTRTQNDLRVAINVLKDLRANVALNDVEFKKLTATINRYEGELNKASGTAGKFSKAGQTLGAVAAGGVFGGPEGLIGGAIGAFGGPAGALAGAAIGAQVGMVRQQIGELTEYASTVDRLNIALRGVAGGAAQYQQALSAIQGVSRDLNIPILDATRGFTRLTAAVTGAGGNVSDAEIVFRAFSQGIKATGGGAEELAGVMVALTQIFSKGKVSAEEINQIAERMPGTFTMFAKAAGKTGPELSKALQEGKVGLNDFMKFAELVGNRYSASADKMAKSSEDAGARMKVALDALGKNFGEFFKPVGAGIQDLITKMANFANAIFRTSELSKKLAEYNKGLTAENEAALLSDARKIAAMRVLGRDRRDVPYDKLGSREQLQIDAAVYGSVLGNANTGILGELRRDFMTKKLYELGGLERPTATRPTTSFPSPKPDTAENDKEAAKAERDARQRALDLINASRSALTNRAELEKLSAESKLGALKVEKSFLDAIHDNELKRIALTKDAAVKTKELEAENSRYRAAIKQNTNEWKQTVEQISKAGDQAMEIFADLQDQLNLSVRNPFERATITIADKVDNAITKLKEKEKAILEAGKGDEASRQDLDRVREALKLAKEYNNPVAQGRIASEQLTRSDKDNLKQQIADLRTMGRHLTTIEEIAIRYGETWKDIDQSTKDQLTTLANQRDMLARNYEIVNSIGDSIGTGLTNGFNLLVQGSENWGASLRQIAANVLRDIASQLLRILVIEQLISAVKGALGGLMPGGGGGGKDVLSSFNAAAARYASANGNIFAQNGIVPFAMGGVVDRPTIFPFAKGVGLMGEAGPEAIIPLKRGADGKLGVAGGGGTSVVVNVDASGTSVQGDSGNGAALGRAVSQAVQAELIKQRRPGGLLAA